MSFLMFYVLFFPKYSLSNIVFTRMCQKTYYPLLKISVMKEPVYVSVLSRG